VLSHEKVGIESEHAVTSWRTDMSFARQTASAVSALAVSLAVWAAIAIWTGPAGAENVTNENEFGVEVTLPERTLVEALRTVHEYVDRRGLKPDGEAMMIYTGADDTGFEYKAAVPIMGPFENPPKGDLAVGPAPTGKAYKFVHRGAYDGMENLYEAITNFFDEKNIQPGELFIERYVTDPRTTPEDELVIEVIFPTK
jgi:effector-binding domain-containing protein